MIIVRETTVWEEAKTPNHIYVLSDDKSKMYGYVRAGTLEHKTFSKPMSFDARGRTFKLLKKVESKSKAASKETKTAL